MKRIKISVVEKKSVKSVVRKKISVKKSISVKSKTKSL